MNALPSSVFNQFRIHCCCRSCGSIWTNKGIGGASKPVVFTELTEQKLYVQSDRAMSAGGRMTFPTTGRPVPPTLTSTVLPAATSMVCNAASEDELLES